MVTWRLPWRGRSATSSPPAVGDPELVVLASGADDAVPSSAALGEAGFRDERPVVLRHLLRLPAEQTAEVTARCVAEGYVVDESVAVDVDADGLELLAVARVTVVDAVSLSRERSRMASIVSRARGRVDGWALLGRGDTPVTGATP